MSSEIETVEAIETLSVLRQRVADAEAALRAAQEELKIAEGRLDPIDLLLVNRTVSDMRRETLLRAIDLGAPQRVLIQLRDAKRVRREPTIRLPRGKYASCARGRDWCRMGRGDAITWGELDDSDSAYEVGPGKWTVGSTDGFRRTSNDMWVVKNVSVGEETWTIAN